MAALTIGRTVLKVNCPSTFTRDRKDDMAVLGEFPGRPAMYEDTEKFVDLDFEQRVRQTAYHLWEDSGRPFGEEKKYWFMAMERLLAERTEDVQPNPSLTPAPRAAFDEA